MSLSVFEILDKFKVCETDEERRSVLKRYSTNYFKQYLKYCFDPKYEFYFNEFPDDYIRPDVGHTKYANIASELYRTYIFVKGNEIADSLPVKKRNELFVGILESFEYEEAESYVNMMKKDINIPHLTPELIREVIPGLLPDAS